MLISLKYVSLSNVQSLSCRNVLDLSANAHEGGDLVTVANPAYATLNKVGRGDEEKKHEYYA